MPNTVQYRLPPNGYQIEINGVRESMPDADESAVILKWVTDKFGSWIARNLTEQFRFENARSDGFEILFEQQQHAQAFVRDVGGRLK